MKQFSGSRSVEDIQALAKQTGWEVSTDEFDKGSDWIYFRDDEERGLRVAFNTTNGHFYVYKTGHVIASATHPNAEFDQIPWYSEILNLVYLPKKETADAN